MSRGDAPAPSPFWRRALRPAARSARAMLREARWARHVLAADPRRALLSRRLARINGAHFRDVLAQRAGGADAYLAPFAAKPVPRTLWVFWAQGEAAAPPIVAACLARMRAMQAGWDVRVLDLAAAEALVDMTDVAADRAASLVRYSDILRLRLLEAHGGVWVDATVWLHRPLDEWLPLLAQRGLFMFRRPRPERIIDPWLIAAAPAHPIVLAWQRSLCHFARTHGTAEWPYFQVTYCFQHALDRDPGLRDAFEDTGGLPAPPTFLLLSALEGRSPEAVVVDLLRSGLPLSKLAFRSPLDPDGLVNRIEALESRARGVERGSGPAAAAS